MEKEPFSPEMMSHEATQHIQYLQTSAFQTLGTELFSLGSQQLMGNAHSFWELDRVTPLFSLYLRGSSVDLFLFGVLIVTG